ncbi:MAG: hypothetical protein GF320_09990 [Armatimonadia bacterium]|nr:hypothetical protein [Armatimonadia bacterium]
MPELQTLQCPNCGAQATFDPSALARACEFCGSEFEIPVPDEFLELQRRSVLVPFRVEKPSAFRAFDEWLQKGLFKPGDLLQVLQRRGVEGMYVPFWSFEVEVRTQWHGQYSVTRYRTVSKTRTTSDGKTEHYQEDEPYKEWHPRSGVHDGRYVDHIVASGALEQDEADQIMPYDFVDARPWDDDYISGFKAEVPGRPEEDAWRAAAARIEEYERQACDREIERLDSANTQIVSRECSLSYLPTWIFTYSYKGQVYRAMVNGQTGEVQGTKPISAGKVAIAIIVGVVVIAAIIGLIIFLGKGG